MSANHNLSTTLSALAARIEDEPMPTGEPAESVWRGRQQVADELRALLREHQALGGLPADWREAVAAEPELPGGMPEEMGHAVAQAMAAEDADFFLAALRLAVRLTKDSIHDRLAALEASEKGVTSSLGVTPASEGFCLDRGHREHAERTGEQCSCPKYTRHPDCDKTESRAGLPAENPWSGERTPYQVERHGPGWAIYQGRDSQHHGMNLGLLTECSPELARQVERGLNALGE